MQNFFFPQEEDFKRWIRESIRQELTTVLEQLKVAGTSGDEPLLTRKEIAAYLKISLVTLHDRMKNRELPFHKKRGGIRFLKSEVLEWVKENEKEPWVKKSLLIKNGNGLKH